MKKLPAGFSYSNRDLKNLVLDFGLSGSVCHVGSLLNGKPPGAADRLRNGFAKNGLAPFVGVDMFPGENVDVVADLCDPQFFARRPELKAAFDLVYSSALLEHVADPFACARTITGLIKPGGHLWVAGPWVQGYHAYPDDYWRISHSGLRVLFPDLVWRAKWYQGTIKGEGRFTVDCDNPRNERKLFAIRGVSTPVAISDRAMANLNVCGLGMLPTG